MYCFLFIVYSFVLNYCFYCYIVNNISCNIVTCCFGSYNIVQLSKNKHLTMPACSDGSEFSNTRIRTPWRTAWRLVGSGGHFRPCWTLTKQVKMAVGPIGPDHAGLLRRVRIFKHTYTNLVEPHGDLWAQGTTFGRVGPLRRQLLLLYHPCLAYRSQPLGC